MDFGTSLGMCVWLMSHSNYHKQWNMRNLDLEIMAPLAHNQIKIYLDQDQTPVGFATWAWIGDEQREKVLDDNGVLNFDEWNSGKYLLFHDYVAPWGHAKTILKDLRTNVFPNETAFSLGRNSDGTIRKVYQWKGINVTKKIFENTP